MHQVKHLTPAALAAVLLGTAAVAAPVPGQIKVVGIYLDALSPFGLGYDSKNDLIWFSRGDSGDSSLHSLTPWKNFTPAQIAAFNGGVLVDGVPAALPGQANQDVAGTTAVPGLGPFGFSGGYFSSLAFDSKINQIVAQGNGATLRSFDPLTGAGLNANYAPGSAGPDGFSDGLSVTGGNVWWSPDGDDIFKNGVLFASGSNAAQHVPGQSVGSGYGTGWSGVEAIGNELFAAALLFGNEPRTLVKFDAAGNLVGYDPDGDPAAERWEDLAYDGRYLYAADLRGNANGTGNVGDIYVFDTGGGIVIGPIAPEASTSAAGLGLALMVGGTFYARRRQAQRA